MPIDRTVPIGVHRCRIQHGRIATCVAYRAGVFDRVRSLIFERPRKQAAEGCQTAMRFPRHWVRLNREICRRIDSRGRQSPSTRYSFKFVSEVLRFSHSLGILLRKPIAGCFSIYLYEIVRLFLLSVVTLCVKTLYIIFYYLRVGCPAKTLIEPRATRPTRSWRPFDMRANPATGDAMATTSSVYIIHVDLSSHSLLVGDPSAFLSSMPHRFPRRSSRHVDGIAVVTFWNTPTVCVCPNLRRRLGRPGTKGRESIYYHLSVSLAHCWDGSRHDRVVFPSTPPAAPARHWIYLSHIIVAGYNIRVGNEGVGSRTAVAWAPMAELLARSKRTPKTVLYTLRTICFRMS